MIQESMNHPIQPTYLRVVINYLFFIYSLFKDAFSISDKTASNERMMMIVNNELEKMWKEAVVA
jgi:hypothetical protein